MITFIFIKYVSLGMNAARSLVLAALLGPESYGFLGTLVIVQQYVSYAALGMREGITMQLTQARSHSREVLCDSAIAWGIGVGCAVLLILCMLIQLDNLRAEWYLVGVISMLSITNEILINIYRDDGRLKRVALLEVVYNSAPLGCAMWFGKDVTVELVLQSLAVGVAFSVSAYLWGLPRVRLQRVDTAAIRSLLAAGIPLGISAFFSASVTSIYVLLANSQHLGREVGLIAFANSVCIIVLYGSNVVAWAATSKSMRSLTDDARVQEGVLWNQRLTYFFRVAILASVLVIALSGPLVTRLMPAYAGMERYATLFCLLQATTLMLYVELNYLAVRGRSAIVAVGYAMTLAVVLSVWKMLSNIKIDMLISLGVCLTSIAGVMCAAYCHRLGLMSSSLRSNYFFLAFPSFGVLALHTFGTPAAGWVASLFLVRALFTGRRLILNGG